MDNSIIKKLIKNLFDKPLENNNKSLFVNRENEFQMLDRILNFQPQGVYGLCGETGNGKTSFLNTTLDYEIKSYFLAITEKENKEIIIADLLFKLCTYISKQEKGKLKSLAEETRKWIIEETHVSRSFQVGFNAVAAGGVAKGSSNVQRFSLFEAKERLFEILTLVRDKHDKVLLIIDELDKEKKDEVLLILDSLKQILFQDDLITVVSLPFSIYREYAKDVMRWNETGNLENIFRDMFFLNPLNEDEIREMLLKRMAENNTLLSNEIFHEIYRYSDGNPRDALSITQEIILDNRRKGFTRENVLSTIKAKVKRLISSTTEFTDIQKKILRSIADNPGKRSDIVNQLDFLKNQTVYTYINRFLNNGVLKETDGIIRLSGRFYYYFQDS